MRKLKLFLSLLMLFTFSVGNVWADVGDVYYTFLPYKPSKGAVSDYTQTGTMTIDELKWTVPGNWYANGALRLGGKNLDGVDRTITGQDPIGDAIAKIVITHNGVTSDNLILNSVKVTVASNAAFSQNVVDTTLTSGKEFTYAKNTAGTISIELTDGFWAKDSYYKFDFNISNSNSSNYAFVLNKIEFYSYEEGSSNPTVSFEQPTTGTLALSVAGSPIESGAEVAENTEVTITATPGEGYKLPATISFKDGENQDVDPDDLTFIENDDKNGGAFLMPAYDLTVAASFTAKASYTVTVDKAVYDKNGDLVEPTPEGFTAIVKGGSTSTTVLEDGEVTIVAEPKAGYEFAGWFLDNDDYADIENDEAAETKLINFTHDVTVYADFEELTTPSLAVDPASLDFGSVGVGSTPMPLQFTLTGANLTDNSVPVTLDAALNGVFTLSHQQVKVGSGAVNQVITVTPNTANVGEYSGNITITATNAESKTVALSLTVLQTYTATWYVNGTATKTQTAAAGTALEVPADPETLAAECSDLKFRGWATAPISGSQASAPDFVNFEGAVMGTADANYYAVFATETKEEIEGDPEWVATAFADLATDDVVVVTITKPGTNAGTYALPNDNGAKSAPTATTITITDNQIDAPADNLQWDVVKDGDNITFNVHGSTTSWLFCKDTNNGVRVGNTTDDSDATNKVFILSDGDLSKNYYLKSTTLTRYIGVYNAQDWRCYSSINSNLNSGDQELTFFKKTVSKQEIISYSDFVTTCVICTNVTLTPAEVENGSITLSKESVKTCEAAEVTVTPSPATGYELANIALSGVDGATYAEGVISIPADAEGTLTVTATFSAINYTVAVAQTGGAGSELSGATDAAHYGEEITVSATAVDGYYFIGWEATGITLENAQALSQTFNMPANNVSLTAKFTKILTVAEAIAAIDEAGTGTTINDQVIEAYISQIDSYNSKYSSITYWIKDIDANGFLTGTNFEVFGGLGLDGEGFTGVGDIVVGAKVRIFGQIKYYTDGEVYEFNSNNYLLSYDAPENPSVVVYGTATKTAYEVGDSFDFDGLSAKTAYDNKYATAIAEPEWAADPATIAANTTSVSVTANGAGAKNIDVSVLTHELTFNATPENGTVSVVYNDNPVATGDHFVKGDVLTITATPADGYELDEITVINTATSEDVTASVLSGLTITMPTFDITVNATFAELPVPNFYIAGSMTSWETNKIPVYDESYTIENLAAGSYELKVIVGEAWKGFANLTASEIVAGLYAGGGDNICFTLAEAGDVTVTYGATFKMAGNFVPQTVRVKGGWDGWAETHVMILSGDKKSASVTFTLPAAEKVEFGIDINGDDFRANGYHYHRGYTGTAGITGNSGNMTLTSDVTGEYTFTWTFGTNAMNITFPHIYTIVSSDIIGDLASVTLGNMEKKDDVHYELSLGVVDHVLKGSYNIEVYEDNAGDPVGVATLEIEASGKYEIRFSFDASEENPFAALGVEAINRGSATDIDETGDGQKAVKMMKDNTIYILRGNKTYTITGQLVK